MKVLIGCEFSGTVRDAFLERGHDALSCDILDTEKQGPHYKGDDADSAFKKLLDQDDDIDRILLDEEPQTDRLKLVVKKFKKDKEFLRNKLKECEGKSGQEK